MGLDVILIIESMKNKERSFLHTRKVFNINDILVFLSDKNV